MMEIATWVGANWMLIVGTVSSVIAGASIIVKAISPFTATKVDDKAARWLDKVYKYLNKIALNTPKV